MKASTLCIAVAFAVALTACSEPAQLPAEPVATTPPPAPPVAIVTTTDAWIGDWNGPEGTGLRIEGSVGRYTLTIRDLDGPRRFDGVADGDTIRFRRDGVDEVLRAGDGDATGMKWLAGKTDCLLLRAGEGWCRP